MPTNQFKLAGLALIVLAGTSVALGSGVFLNPTQPPPGGNPDAPIHVGVQAQTKQGSLTISDTVTVGNRATIGQLFVNTDTRDESLVGIQAWGKSIFNSPIQIIPGAGAGKVLTSSADGTASWQKLPEGISLASVGRCSSGQIFMGFDETGSKICELLGDSSNAATISGRIMTFSQPGTHTWEVPAGVTSFTVEAWGGGESGYVAPPQRLAASNYYHGNGGSSGGYGKKVFTVSKKTYTFVVGKGGGPVISDRPGVEAGSDTSFDNTLIARGGSGTGGTVSGADVSVVGNTGDHATSVIGTGGTGASAPNGGQGGEECGGNATEPGAGGGGSCGPGQKPGWGAPGRVIISW